MAEARIEVEIGQFRFSGQGEEQWLAQQMDKIIKSAETLINLAPPPVPVQATGGQGGNGSDPTPADEALPQFLARTNATANQVRKFLATAEWLHRKGTEIVKTTNVTQALRDAHQKRLKNASDCLAKNAAKGFCVKDGAGFYVTDEGRKHLGLQ